MNPVGTDKYNGTIHSKTYGSGKRPEELRILLASIVESSQDAVIGKTMEGMILTWNRGAKRSAGIPRRGGGQKYLSETIAGIPRGFQFICPGDL
jgi:PAS domain-containing protein